MQNGSLGIIYNKRGEILLVQRKDVPVWVLPGGGIEKEESPEMACIREVFEETGIKISAPTFVALYTPVNFLSAKTFLFQTTVSDQTIVLDHKEASLAEFFPLQKLPRSLFFLHKTFIDEVQNCAQLPYKRTLHEVTYAKALKYAVCHPLQTVRYLLTRTKNMFR